MAGFFDNKDKTVLTIHCNFISMGLYWFLFQINRSSAQSSLSIRIYLLGLNLGTMEGSLKFEDRIYSRNYQKLCLGMCSENSLKKEDGQGLDRVLARPLSGHLTS